MKQVLAIGVLIGAALLVTTWIQGMPGMNVNKARELCIDRGGVYEYYGDSIRDRVECRNGEIYFIRPEGVW